MPDAPVDFHVALGELFASVRRATGRANRIGGQLTVAQYAVLEPLRERTSLGVGEIAAAAGVTGPSATRALKALEVAGLVRREEHPEDGRAVVVSLTPAGRRALAEKHAYVTDREARLYAALSPEERRHAVGLLRHLAAVIEEL